MVRLIAELATPRRRPAWVRSRPVTRLLRRRILILAPGEPRSRRPNARVALAAGSDAEVRAAPSDRQAHTRARQIEMHAREDANATLETEGHRSPMLHLLR